MTLAAGEDIWRNCNICKTGIGFGRDYFVCSVSTCNRKRTGLIFCGLSCFEAHLPEARHRDAWAEQARAPTRAEWQAALNADTAAEDKAAGDKAERDKTPERENAPAVPGARARIVPPAAARTGSGGGDASAEPEVEIEVLVVVSKLKKFIRDWSGMNTSDSAVPVLSDHLRELCREAIRQAGLDGRRTVLDRDFVKVLSQRRDPR